MLDLFSVGQHLLTSSGINIGWGWIVQHLVVALVIVVLNERFNSLRQFPGIVVSELDHVLHRAVVAFDLARSTSLKTVDR